VTGSESTSSFLMKCWHAGVGIGKPESVIPPISNKRMLCFERSEEVKEEKEEGTS